MAAPSRRAVANAVAAHLAGVANATGYYGQIGRGLPGVTGTPADPPVKDQANGDLRVKPYFVLYPSAGSGGPDPDLGDTTTGLTQPLPVTAVAGDVEDLLALCDRIVARFDTWRPTLTGVAFDRVRFPLGYEPGPYLIDDQFKPERLYIRLPFQITATT